MAATVAEARRRGTNEKRVRKSCNAADHFRHAYYNRTMACAYFTDDKGGGPVAATVAEARRRGTNEKRQAPTAWCGVGAPPSSISLPGYQGGAIKTRFLSVRAATVGGYQGGALGQARS